MLYIFMLLALAVFLIKRSDHERNTLKTERYHLASEKIRKKHKLVFLSDLHEKEFGERNAVLLEKIRREKPDLVLIGGDLVISRKGAGADEAENAAALLRALRAEHRVYMGLGNHESRLLEKAGYRRYEELFENKKSEGRDAAEREARLLAGAMKEVELLDRRSVFTEGERELCISGITLPMRCYRRLFLRKKPELEASEIRRLGGFPEAEDQAGGQKPCFRIALLHSPLYYREAIRAGADLVLSGHIHGGTVRIPGIGALMTPQLQFFFRECAGLFRYREGWVLVNRGLGTHSVNLRLNDFPEISVIELVPLSEKGERSE